MMSLEVDKDKLIHWLQELVRIPSITGNEKAISKYVSQELHKMGYRPQIKENNVFFEIGDGSKSLLLNAHLDTVDIGGEWKHEPFGAVTEKGKMFGRGVSDDKGNIAAMLEIARLAKDRKINGRLIFTFTTGEEFGTQLEEKGSYLLSQFLKAEKALVLEPQTDVEENKINIIYGCRGIENILVRIKGKGSHTGYPERGSQRHLHGCRSISHAGKDRLPHSEGRGPGNQDHMHAHSHKWGRGYFPRSR